jgi:hypothetical protein
VTSIDYDQRIDKLASLTDLQASNATLRVGGWVGGGRVDLLPVKTYIIFYDEGRLTKLSSKLKIKCYSVFANDVREQV